MIVGSLGLVTMPPVTFPGVVIDTEAQFEARLKSSTDRTAAIEALLKAPDGEDTKTRLLAALRERFAVEKADQAHNDEFGGRLAVRIGDLATPAELVSLLDNAMTMDTLTCLASGFRHPAGREYLIARVSDPHEPANRRERWVYFIGEIGWAYQRDAREGNAGHVDFAAQLAGVAVERRGTNDLSRLLEAVVRASDREAPAGSPLAADCDAAAKKLADAFADAPAPDRFALAEAIMQLSATRYKALLPTAGPMLTQIEPNRDFVEHLKKRSLHLQCRFRNQLKVKSTLRLVLQPTNSGSDVVADIDKPLGEMTDTFGSAWAIKCDLPETVAAGSYHAFLRVFVDGKLIGDGIGFVVVVPKR